MLTSLILHLQAPTKTTLPASLGRAGQALLLRLVAERDPILAETLHSGDNLRPFTTSNLVIGRREKGSLVVEEGKTGWIRFTALTKTMSEHLVAIAATPPSTVEIDRTFFTVTQATINPADHPWANQISYQDLAAPYLLGGKRPAPIITLKFASPTTFRSQGRYIPLPLPESVFGSLLNKWQTFAPIALNPEVRRFAEQAIALSRYNIRSRGITAKNRGVQVGFTGEVTFRALNRDPYWLNVLHLLAAFAFYAGVGYQTTTGLGQVGLR